MIVAAIASLAFMVALSVYAYFHVAPGQENLPMQWSLSGRPGWQASRLMALSLTPLVLGGLMAVVLSAADVDPNEQATVITAMAGVGPCVHALHIFLIARLAGR